ncbi:MFS transporter [Psychrosphaera sp. B3R10]|uniref:MFS transporter n=1 Tax=unclassified Psychrosphaera TaxID=2641570 RepID=UPI001C0A0215|nr:MULTISPECIES: MFS transporter [unclassified Psychrosphaera]MBU2881856.1 MFS transporter [Psychrosphaera sp. I2R16]MBU2989877.1 MFS transporter [Psychrosphaera sp. B3R10]MDO6720947.1 MFS transporter [Psychrosphaera sp. 1_MG-2023]
MTTIKQPHTDTESAQLSFSQGYKRYALFLLVMVSIFNAIDKTVFSALLEPIKVEFMLSDLQLGIVSGLAFSLFYATLGLPFARWADLGNRRTLLTLTVGFWSFMTVLTGLAQNYWQMFLARVGVGIGEGGGHPAALSMLSDLYSTKSGGLAISLFLIGGTIGSVVGLAGGSFIAGEWGWRYALVLMGAPGILLALLIRLTMKEPRKVCRFPNFSEVLGKGFMSASRTLFSKNSFFYCIIGFTVFAVFGQGSGQWTMSYLIRHFELDLAQAGGSLGFVMGVSGVLGMLFGGLISNFIGKVNVKWYIYFPILVIILLIPITVAIYISSSLSLVYWMLGVSGTLVGLMTPPIFALVFGISGVTNKALGIAILGMLATLVGGGLGPMIIGGISDVLSNYYGDDALRLALLTSVLFLPLSILFFYLASRTLEQEFEN